MSARPCIGLLVPPAHGRVPPDAPLLYGGRFDFIARGIGIGAVSPQGFAPVIDRVVDLARELRAAGAEAISLMGTSISFYRGPEFTATLREAMHQATGVACTTMSHAVASALRELGVRRVAVATSYIDELNDRLVSYLTGLGHEVSAIEGLGIPEVGGAAEVTTRTLIGLCRSVVRRAPDAEAVFMSCGGLSTLEAIQTLEAELGLPVIGSSPSGFWDVVRAGGWDPRSAQGGRLFTHT